MEHYNPIFSKVPTLRFDFDGIWNKIHLYEITNKVSRKAPVNSTAPIRMISYGNGFILQSDKYSRDNAGESLKKYTLLKKGEMAYNHGASKNKKYGVCYSLKESDEARIPFVYHAFQINRGLPAFWNYALNISQIDKQLKKLVSSGARMDGLLNISYDDYMSISVYEPCVDEQAKISAFLSVIDKRIAVQNKIISKYETLIKGICCYMVKKANSNIYKLGMLTDIYQPMTIAKTDLPDDGIYPVYGANGIIGYSNQYNHKESQIMITCRGSTCGTVNLSAQYSWITGNSMVINIEKHKNLVDKKYLYYYLKTLSFNNLISGSGQPQIIRKPFVNLDVRLPSLSQQIKYREIIDTFEKALKNEEEMLSDLQMQKTFLLQSMFI